LISLYGNSSLVTSIILRSEEAELYSGLKGGLVVIWDLESSKVKYNLQGHSAEVTAITMSKCEGIPTFLATASLDGKIKWWDIRAKGTPMNIKGHLAAVKSLAISPDCNFVASGAEDGLVRLWDIRANKLIREFNIPDQGTINCVEFNPHSYTLAYGSNDKLIKHWDLNEFSLISVTTVDKLPIQKINFDHTGNNIFSGTNDTIKLWDVEQEDTAELIYMAETGWNKLQDLKYVEDEAVYAVNTYGNKIGYYMIPYDMIATNMKARAGGREDRNYFNNNYHHNHLKEDKINSNENLISHRGRSNNPTNTNLNTNNIHISRANSDILSDFNNVDSSIAKHISNIQNNINIYNNHNNSNHINNNNIFNSSSSSNFFNNRLNEAYSTENIFNTNQSDNVFVRNGK